MKTSSFSAKDWLIWNHGFSNVIVIFGTGMKLFHFQLVPEQFSPSVTNLCTQPLMVQNVVVACYSGHFGIETENLFQEALRESNLAPSQSVILLG